MFPDLNPTENLWWDLKKAVAARKPKNIIKLEAFAHEETTGKRLLKVIKVKGYSTKY